MPFLGLLRKASPVRGLDGACLAGDWLRLDRSLQLPDTAFFPCRLRRLSSRAKKAVSGSPLLYSGPRGAVPIVSGPVDSHRGREGRGPKQTERNFTMATVGTFTSTANGFTGSIKTLTLNVKARLERIQNPTDKGPHFRVFSGAVELGAAWEKHSEQSGRDYLSVKLDDPSFPGPIYATLVEVEGGNGLSLIWSRPNRD